MKSKTVNVFRNSGPMPESKDEKLLNWIKSNLPKKRQSLYDFGAGYGTWTKQIADLGAFTDVNITEPDNVAYNYTKKTLGDKFNSSLEKYDLIISFAVLELLDLSTNSAQLKKFKDLLETERSKILILYNFYHRWSLRWILLWLVSLGNPKEYHQTKKFHRSYLSFKDFSRICDDNGFSISDWYAPSFYRGRGPSSKFLKMPWLFSTVFLALERKTTTSF